MPVLHPRSSPFPFLCIPLHSLLMNLPLPKGSWRFRRKTRQSFSGGVVDWNSGSNSEWQAVQGIELVRPSVQSGGSCAVPNGRGLLNVDSSFFPWAFRPFVPSHSFAFLCVSCATTDDGRNLLMVDSFSCVFCRSIPLHSFEFVCIPYH